MPRSKEGTHGSVHKLTQTAQQKKVKTEAEAGAPEQAPKAPALSDRIPLARYVAAAPTCG